MSSISTTIRRVDSPAKIAGSEHYLADMKFYGALQSRLVLSERSRARITSVGVPPLPEGYATVDHTDIPGRNQIHVINDNWPLFPEDIVEYVGQPILMIVGPDPAVLDDMVRSTVVEYEDLEAVLGLDDAETQSSPPVFAEYQLESGVPESNDAATVNLSESVELSETFDTGAQEHIYLEPQAMAAWYDDEKINVIGSTQCPFYIRTGLMGVFGWEADRVRVVQAATGGGFGGKEEWPSLLAGYVAVAAYKVRKPVRIVLDRSEDIRITTKRHPSRTSFSTVADADGVRRTSIDARIDGGAFEGLSSTVLQRMMFSATGAYRVPPATVRGRAYQTNIVPYGAFRGFGSPQAFFAIEMHMNHLARELGMDPLEFKRRQLLAQGGKTITGGTLRDPIKMNEMIDIALKMSEYAEKRQEYSIEAASGGRGIVRRGIGMSLFSHGCGFTGNGERDIIKARVKLRRQPTGSVEILAANVEMGQGAETTLRKIVAHTLGMPIEQVIYEKPDTDRVPDSGPTVASRTSMIVGGLLHKAATELKDRLPSAGDEMVEIEAEYEQPVEIEWDQTAFRGDAYPGFSWGVNVIEIEIDMITYAVQPTNVWAVYDIGTAIDEQVVIGQVHGGIVQGLGYALSENLEVKNGRFQQHTMTDYIIPGSLDVPPIDVRLVSNPHRYGPFGAKGAGEIPFTGVAPAIADAVENSLGKRVYRVPLIPEYLEEVDR